MKDQGQRGGRWLLKKVGHEREWDKGRKMEKEGWQWRGWWL